MHIWICHKQRSYKSLAWCQEGRQSGPRGRGGGGGGGYSPVRKGDILSRSQGDGVIASRHTQTFTPLSCDYCWLSHDLFCLCSVMIGVHSETRAHVSLLKILCFPKPPCYCWTCWQHCTCQASGCSRCNSASVAWQSLPLSNGLIIVRPHRLFLLVLCLAVSQVHLACHIKQLRSRQMLPGNHPEDPCKCLSPHSI